VVTGGGNSRTGSGWSRPTVTSPSALTYGQTFFPSTFPHTNDPPNRTTFIRTGYYKVTSNSTDPVVPTPTP
jgi:hypothetical protein